VQYQKGVQTANLQPMTIFCQNFMQIDLRMYDESIKTETPDTDLATTSSGEWSQPCSAFLGDSEMCSINEGESFSSQISIHWDDDSDGK
jgi:hypothetical protein